MLFLGMLSILQIAFLPGYLAVRALRMDDGAIKTWISSFTMSLLINHLIVCALVMFHGYYGLTVYLIFLVELVILAWMEYARLGTPVAVLLAQDRQRFKDLLTSFNEGEPATRWVGRGIVLAAAVTLLIYLLRFTETSHIFSAYDAVVSWNKWAVDWYHNQFPVRTQQYPQLLPTNWSISYVFIGNATVQFFAKMIMPLFPLTILLAATDLGLRSRNLGFIFAVSTTGFLLRSWGGDAGIGDLIDSGFADTPLACMAFASVYALLLAKDAETDIERHKHLLVGAVLCAGAALTKQPGLYLAAVYPLLSFLLVLNETKGSGIAKAKAVVIGYGLLIVLIAPWHVYTWSLAMRGEDPNNLPDLTGLYLHRHNTGRNAGERFVFAIRMIEASLGPLLTYLVIPVGLFFGAFRRTWRRLLVGVFAPWFLVWAILFSYDIRNIALVLPLVGVAVGIGLYDRFSGYARKSVMVVMRGGWRLFAIVLVVASVILSFRYPGKTLVRHQLELQKNIGNAMANRALYEYHERIGLKGKIVTSYQYLGFLPGFEKYYSYLYSSSDVSLKQFLNGVERSNAVYLLWRQRQDGPDVKGYVRDKITSGDWTIIFDVDGFQLIDIRGGNFERIN